jgi:hypothetical protein
VFICWLTTFSRCDDKVGTINVKDTDDEFTINKPNNSDPKYKEFLTELYRHDKAKEQKGNVKRDTSAHEKVNIEDPKAFDIPAKPAAKDEKYGSFLSHLYRHDDLKRSKRMIVYRYNEA